MNECSFRDLGILLQCGVATVSCDAIDDGAISLP